ncbi:AAA family ATPase [Branchiibius sp. NY16-3462-2]|uniref:AAA family ATPase n=1 Tax=Branchiibius sp. NY16-3462-2 TaxID=1807500 RepID=UPI000A7CC9E1|nr:AAA family ATPase [Branchiibius sp. NY16-3462-2]
MPVKDGARVDYGRKLGSLCRQTCWLHHLVGTQAAIISRMALDDFAGFGINGYRSFGSGGMQQIGPMEKIHLVVGKNDVGKSNTLAFASQVLHKLRNGLQQSDTPFFAAESDVPRGWEGSQTISIGLKMTPDVQAKLLPGSSALSALFSTSAYSRGNTNTTWFDFEGDMLGEVPLKASKKQFEEGMAVASNYTSEQLQQMSQATLSQSSGVPFENYTNLILGQWKPWEFIPPIHWIDTFRRIDAEGTHGVDSTVSGRGLIQRLASLANPDAENYESDIAKWHRLNSFIRAVLDDDRATIQIPDSKSTINVMTSTYTATRLEQLGTGIAEVIFHAAVATLKVDHLVCIEEPELHLHPTLQRMLVQYLEASTDNHYLISTHSAPMINAEFSSITHLIRQDRWTEATSIAESRELAIAISDLGNRASDIVQSNFIIWVEGPTDRLYIAHWLSQCDGELIEGVHYSIMFYGGAMLNHLSADDRETNELINLMRVNRNIAVVMDSDRRKHDEPLNETKLRILSELDDIGAMSWVTEGYTIENYISSTDLKSALKDEYPDRDYAYPSGLWKSPLGKNFKDSSAGPSKVTIARNIIKRHLPMTTWSADLTTHISEVARRIREANGLKVG